ncbi:uncharacterized protein LOC128206725 [Mya arenaria]|uniref:uncharacterized protein LOC128206725 n=1 Tax=Mya arenaria TaxID=6604 RepID=UPI0022E153CF|nr:uncharacterized protein LOC128206725 [Mya arenaria]
MMIKVALILFAVVVVATATPFLQLGDDDVLGDVDVEISVRGGHKTLTYKTPNGNVIDVTHVLKSEDVIVNIPGQNEVCNVRQLQQTINDVEGSLTCTERIAMTDEELSPKLAEICRGKAVFAEKYAPCQPRTGQPQTGQPRIRRDYVCEPVCRLCSSGLCCEIRCTGEGRLCRSLGESDLQ